jgi:hypothetical protein
MHCCESATEFVERPTIADRLVRARLTTFVYAMPAVQPSVQSKTLQLCQEMTFGSTEPVWEEQRINALWLYSGQFLNQPLGNGYRAFLAVLWFPIPLWFCCDPNDLLLKVDIVLCHKGSFLFTTTCAEEESKNTP